MNTDQEKPFPKSKLCWLKISMLSIMLIFFGVLSAQNYSQPITLNLQNATFKEFVKQIESKTPFTIVFRDMLVDNKKDISINVYNKPLNEVIKSVLALKGLYANYKNNTIVIIKKEPKEIDQEPVKLKKITGLVTDEKGEPIIGATVVLKGSNTGTITSAEGFFSLEIPQQSQIIISYIGFKQSILNVGKADSYKIILEEDSKALNEVVVVGYGTQKKSNITGAISSLSNKDFSERSNNSFGTSMQGKSAGVQVTIPTGEPQSGFSIRVRGTSSINAGSEPLYVVDGIPTSSTKDINPADIETMSILKDAASAAIYGSSGANGVVIITTKRGTIQKPIVEIDASYGFTTAQKKMDLLNASQYQALMKEIGNNSINWSDYPYDTDWQDKLFRKGVLQNYQVSIKGGTEKARYYFSGGKINTDGIVITNNVNRYNFKMNLDLSPTDWLKAGGSFAYSSWKDVAVPQSKSSAKSGTIMSMLNTTPIIDVYNSDGSFTGNPFMISFENPLASIYGIKNLYRSARVLGNVYIEAEPIKNLVLKSLLGIDYSNGKYEDFLDPYKTDWGRANKGVAYESANINNYLISQNTISYKKSFKDSYNFSVLGGYIASTMSSESFSASSKNFSSSAVQTVNGGSMMVSMASNKSFVNNQSYILNLNFDYKNKYLFTGNFRADGASNFGPNNKWGYFPSLSVGWRVSQEDFLIANSTISDLKLRAGWGQVGNSGINAYASYGAMSSAPYYMQGSVQSGKIPYTIDNYDLKWEATEQSNIGLDAAFFNNRLVVTIDAYSKKTKDLLYDSPLAYSTGYGSSLRNIGSVSNKGLEFSVSSKNLVNEFKWYTDFNISFNKNEVISLGGRDLMVGYIYGREEVSIIREGCSLGTFYGYVSEGVDPQTGMIKYKGANSSGDVSASNKEIIGDANPLFIAGLTNTFSFKGFDLSVLLQSVYGNDVFNATRIDTEGMFNFYNQTTKVLKRWKIAGQKTDIPKAIAGNTSNSLISSRFIEDGSYLRVKSVSLGYNLPTLLLNKIKIKELKLYVTAENLLTFTHYSGYDPEVSMFLNNGANSEQNGAIGIDYGTYPQSRSVILGLTMKL